MPPEQLIRKSGHIADGDSDRDKMINMAVLHDNVDLADHTSIDIFRNQFLFANGQMSSYKQFDVYDQGGVGGCVSLHAPETWYERLYALLSLLVLPGKDSGRNYR
jgi:hypothetical protein